MGHVFPFWKQSKATQGNAAKHNAQQRKPKRKTWNVFYHKQFKAKQREVMQRIAKQTVTCDTFAHISQAKQRNANTKAKQPVTWDTLPPSTSNVRQSNENKYADM